MTKLIFVEGVSGVGKTSTAQKLCDKLRGMGYSAVCYLEGDIANPIDFYGTAYFKQDEYAGILAEYNEFSEDIKGKTIAADDIRLVRYYDKRTPLFTEPLLDVLRKHELCWKSSNLVPLSEYTCIYKSVWELFARNVSAQYDYILFDGSLLHHPINDMMQNYNVSCDQAIAHANTLVETVMPLHPRVIYLSSDNVAERLSKAQLNRQKTAPSDEQIMFWERRKQMDLAVMQQLSMPCDVFDISQEDWDSAIELISKRITESDEERRARIYPVILSEYNPAWPVWYTEEKAKLVRLLGADNIARISHFGSTSVPGLIAKPTIDILLEINENADLDKLIAALPSPEYICLNEAALTVPTPPPHLRFIKGYLPNGFAEKVYHIHVRFPSDWEETQFRDYLIAHPETVAEYAALKRGLFKDYEHDRDGYTEAKGAFIKAVTEKAREEVTP